MQAGGEQTSAVEDLIGLTDQRTTDTIEPG
jgi:hypothetical protein